MKKSFSQILLIALLLLLSHSSLASDHKITTSHFTLNLPSEIKLVWQKEDDKVPIYQFLFQSPPFGDHAPQQIRITAVGKAPQNITEYDEWRTTALGANIAIFAQAYHLDLKTQKEALAKKPEILTLGDKEFTAATMTFDRMQAYFLVNITKGFTYNIILVSVEKDPKLRKEKMQELLDSIKSLTT